MTDLTHAERPIVLGRHRSTRPTDPARFRPDIEGLRGLAVLLVVGFHAGLGPLGGGYIGVDVFFVLSGFLITGLLVDELRRSGKISLSGFYARRARRLLPMASLVLVATAVMSQFLLPPLDHQSVTEDIRAAALYFSNWHFAALETDYMSDPNKSPILHFWSLSVEEQFYLFWPLLVLGVAAGPRARRRDWSVTTRRLWVALGLVGVGSLLLSVTISQSAGPYAYYGLHTRAWELAVGAALALARPAMARIGGPPRAAAGWLGLVMIVGTAVAYGPDTVFPGKAAVIPVAGAALLLIAGGQRATTPITRGLSSPLMTYIGQRSYGWYLWHWPFLVFASRHYAEASDPETGVSESLPFLPAVVAVAGSFLAAMVSHRLVENPVRRSTWLSSRRGVTLALAVVVTLGAVTVSAASLSASAPQRNFLAAAGRAIANKTPDPAPAPTTGRGAAPVDAPPVLTMQEVREAQDDQPRGIARDCFLIYDKVGAPPGCAFGDPHGARTVVLLGDSHAHQWLPALDHLGKQRHWKVFMWAKAACPFNDVAIWLERFRGEYSACREWRANVLTHLRSLPRIDLVLLSRIDNYMDKVIGPDGSRADASDVASVWERGSVRTIRRLRQVAGNVAFLHATPFANTVVPSCLSEHLSEPASCAFPRGKRTTDALFSAERNATRVIMADLLDLTPAICSTDPCPVVTSSGIIIYRDSHHLTARFARSISGELGAAIDLTGSISRR